MTDYKAYQRWVKTAHERAQFVEVMLSTADMLSESFMNPFDVPEETKLYCLSYPVM